ncbi:MAG: septum formation initiator family protein [Candidatus Krumholzibacteria bacterium]|nr:septum formation initiator family protein [Candidatus Krumholzibacteria bacterium]
MNNLPNPAAKDGFIRGNPTGSVLARHSLAILVGAGLLMMLILSQLGENGIVSWFHLAGRDKHLQQEVAALEKKNQDLDERLHALENDPWALEKIAREEQNMRRPDEEVLMVLPPGDQAH